MKNTDIYVAWDFMWTMIMINLTSSQEQQSNVYRYSELIRRIRYLQSINVI